MVDVFLRVRMEFTQPLVNSRNTEVEQLFIG